MGNHARVPTDDGAEVELYQLCEDIGQKKNLAAEPPQESGRDEEAAPANSGSGLLGPAPLEVGAPS